VNPTCEELREHLPDAVSGDLPAETAAAVARHVAGCASCAAAWAEVAAILGAAARLEAPPLDRPLAAAVLGRLGRVARARRAARFVMAGLAAAAAVVAVPLLWPAGTAVHQPSPPPGVSAFLAGLGGAIQEAGEGSTAALAGVAEAGRDGLQASADLPVPPLRTTDLTPSFTGLSDEWKALTDDVGHVLGEAERAFSWL